LATHIVLGYLLILTIVTAPLMFPLICVDGN
jgi:hypothetical protein